MRPFDNDTIAARNRTQSPLLCLPPELRNKIYEYAMGGNVFGNIGRIHTEIDGCCGFLLLRPIYDKWSFSGAANALLGGSTSPPESTTFSELVSLGLTCHQLGLETKNLLFKYSIFLFQCRNERPDHLFDTLTSAKLFTEEQKSAVRNIGCSYCFTGELLEIRHAPVGAERHPTGKDASVDIKSIFPNLKKVFLVLEEPASPEETAQYKLKASRRFGLKDGQNHDCEVVVIVR